MEELPYRPLLEIKQAVGDLGYILENLELSDEDAINLLDIAYKKAISNREVNQANSHFDKRLKFDKDMFSYGTINIEE